MNDELPQKFEIASLTHDGRGIAFDKSAKGDRGKAVFIRGALPGQKVLAKAGDDHGSWREADLVEILDQGPNQSHPICPHAGECGGCPLQSMPYKDQSYWKQKILLDSMERIGGFDRDYLASVWQDLEPSPRTSEFRNKIELAFENNKIEPYPGMRKRGSHEVIPVEKCALVDAKANKIIKSFTEILHKTKWPDDFWRFLVLRADQDEAGLRRWRLIAISRPGSQEEYAKVRELAETLLEEEGDLHAFIYEIRKDKGKIARGEKRIFSIGKDKEPSSLSLPLGGRKFKADVASFFQVNDGGSEKLAELVKKADSLCDTKTGLLDVYCGVGAPGLLLAPHYNKYLGLELDPKAIEYAKTNAAGLPQCQYEAGDAAKLVNKIPKKLAKSISTVLVDPPRSGLDRRVVNAILKLAPKNIIMVSCNPSTLARDAKLIGKDYELISLAGADLFPHTPHVESCSLWKHK